MKRLTYDHIKDPFVLRMSNYNIITPDEDKYCNEYFTIEITDPNSHLLFIRDRTGSSYPGDVFLSLDNGKTWTTNRVISGVNIGDKVLLKSNAYPLNIDVVAYKEGDVAGYSTTFKASGNPLSLIYGDDFRGVRDISDKEMCFGQLFQNSNITDAGNLSLCATKLPIYCYYEMFDNCQLLEVPPKLPAMTLALMCYENMFKRCSSLVNPPALPATNLAPGCYSYMFQDCTSLVTAPTLPATTLAPYCYATMFDNCLSLVNPPVLPATTLVEGCYHTMFTYCTSLTTSPVLHASTLDVSCYAYMFRGCDSLNSITMLATDISANECLIKWMEGVATFGTLTVSRNANWNFSIIPIGWGIVDEDGNYLRVGEAV